MIQNKHLGRLGLLTALGASAVIFLSGCGGSTNNASPAPSATPTIYGLNPADGSTGSGLQSADAKTGYLTGAISSTAKPLEGTVSLGFPAGGFETDLKTSSSAVLTSQANVTFRALIANGNAGNGISPIVPSSVVLTSPEVSGFSQPMTFDNAGTGNGLNAGQYTTAAFTLPFTTSGIHEFTASLADVAGQTSSTTFGVVVVAPTNVALFAQNITADGQTGTPKAIAIAAGDNVTIDGGSGIGTYPTGYVPTTADAQGTVIFFVTPGTHTLVDTTQKITQTITIPATAAGTAVVQ